MRRVRARYTVCMSFRAFAVSAAIALSFLPSVAAAQTANTSAAPFSVSVSPRYPTPYGSATLSFVSGTVDLSNATVKVEANGTQVYAGNAQDVIVPLSGAGKTVNVRITVTSNGTSSTDTLSITPQDVALVAEPISSAPVWYEGKPFVPMEGATRVVAVANLAAKSGAAVDPASVAYTWTVDGAIQASASGIGKDALIVPSPMQYRSTSVSVSVQSQDGSVVGGDSLTLSPSQPTLRLYQNDPLLGILTGTALSGSFTIAGSETSLYAAPFSFPTSNGSPALEWFLNGSAVQTGNVVTLRPSGSGQGSASISVTSTAGAYTNSVANLILKFGSSAKGIFGL